MSFLNSVLSSINKHGATITTPTVKQPPKLPAASPINGLATGTKRKAEADISTPSAKTPKLDPSTSSEYRKQGQALGPPLIPSQTSELGGSRRPASAVLKEQPAPVVAKVSAAKAPPKKGSYAEILARAKQNQSTAVGVITHKPKEKVSGKREITQHKELALVGKRLDKIKKAVTGSDPKLANGAKYSSPGFVKPDEQKNSNVKPIKSVTASQESAKPKTQTSYHGTARPKHQLVYRGTSKLGISASTSERRKGYESEPDRGPRKQPVSSRRRDKCIDEESHGEDDGYDYNDEDFSDMDAGYDELEEEDEQAARIAKREDAHEQRMLDELKRQKEARKRREAETAEREKGRRH